MKIALFDSLVLGSLRLAQLVANVCWDYSRNQTLEGLVPRLSVDETKCYVTFLVHLVLDWFWFS